MTEGYELDIRILKDDIFLYQTSPSDHHSYQPAPFSRGYTALAFSAQHSLKEVIITNDLIRTIHEDNMD